MVKRETSSETGFPYSKSGKAMGENLPQSIVSRSRFILMASFICLLVAMQFGWSQVRGTELERMIVDEMTAKPSAWLIARITPDIPVRAIGSRLIAPGGGVNILNGCDGTDIVLLLVAAMLVAPITPLQRLSGILIGSGLIYVCNQARIIALFYSYRADKPVFNLLHGLVTPILLILVATSFYILWLGIYHGEDSSQKSIT